MEVILSISVANPQKVQIERRELKFGEKKIGRVKDSHNMASKIFEINRHNRIGCPYWCWWHHMNVEVSMPLLSNYDLQIVVMVLGLDKIALMPGWFVKYGRFGLVEKKERKEIGK